MPKTDIQTLLSVTLDFTQGGPGLHQGLKATTRELESDRSGFLRLEVVVSGATIPIVMRREDLYILGFESQAGWWRFSDADWPLTPDAASLGHDGQYDTLGGLTGSLNSGAIAGIAKLADPTKKSQWKESLRTLLVVVSENLRLTPVRMHLLGVLNGYRESIPLGEVQRYIKNWSKASKGTDMSVETSPNLRVGFKDPTIIRR